MGYTINAFYNAFNNLGETNEVKFKKIINKLLGSNFIIYEKQDDRLDFNFVKNNRQLFESFFNLIGFTLKYKENAYFFIENELEMYANRYIFKKDEILVILILKKLFIEFNNVNKIDGVPKTTLNEVVNRFRPLSNKDIKKTNINAILKYFRRRKIIDYKGDLSSNIDNDIYIYPTINEIVNYDTLIDLDNKIKEYLNSSKKEDEVNDLSN
ncbi:MAG: DUF4194 domain-containing protein [Firmicutes bacterium]|uniref:DUF4194 domain-containing protein n=1 Tax=Candidatus Onthovivens merdipullorum TaxID=2840889 RepID=A0A9D9DHP1_9BACL|nr:DUF4194 domain-containing protein [Candidatus Onthovivens merdipullorum]